MPSQNAVAACIALCSPSSPDGSRSMADALAEYPRMVIIPMRIQRRWSIYDQSVFIIHLHRPFPRHWHISAPRPTYSSWARMLERNVSPLVAPALRSQPRLSSARPFATHTQLMNHGDIEQVEKQLESRNLARGQFTVHPALPLVLGLTLDLRQISTVISECRDAYTPA